MNKILYYIIVIFGILFLSAFLFLTGYDYYMYQVKFKFYSSPFYLYIAVRVLTLFLPGILCLLIAKRMKKTKNMEY